ncbi:MAG: Gfo/Idh/MocA family oxidoreductase [Verrucomicrobiota bacterium]|jgi:predicted dehydrogenase|nr:Gfo/Idh/MocA family oxidoreductase [Verrucomicrobiota bacterium]
MKKTTDGLSRRTFLRRSALAAATFQIVPGAVLGLNGQTPPSGRLNIAGIGVGGQGGANIAKCAETENITALCDVDANYAAHTFKKHPQATVYTDYRELLDKEAKNIDAIVIATPDHTHAAIAMACMKAGKHIYVQKPMAYSVGEARAMTEAARANKVITQMGNQGRSGDGVRMVCEWIWAGAIGHVREVHAWTNRPVWPQGIEIGRPAETPPVPAGLDWDRWLGPAPARPYHPSYHPRNWRAWCDFGTGSLGDLGCHVMDCVYWSLKLKYPVSVEGNISTYWGDFWKKTEPKNEQFPRSSIVRYKFPEREGLPPVSLTWWDGGLQPPRPEELEEGRKMGDDDGGVLFIGDTGKLVCGCYGRSPRLIPETAMKAFERPAKSIERVPGGEAGHEKNWLQAVRDGKQAISHFDYSGPFAEMVLLGNLAVRFPERRLLWDGAAMKVTNDTDAQAFVTRSYRDGWTL